MSGEPDATTSRGSQPAFLLGADPAATALLYRLLCLHPQIAYVCRFERRLPLWLCGRIRLRRFSAKLRWWFRDPAAGRSLRAVMRQLEPAAADALHRRLGLAPAGAAEPPERIAERVRHGFVRLQAAAGGRVLITHASAEDAAVLAALLPTAHYLIVRGGGERDLPAAEPLGSSRAAPATVAPHRVRAVQYRELIQEPLEVMRQVLTFLGLERRLDYEWALKTLNLAAPTPRWPGAGTAASPDRESDEPLGPPGYVS